MKKSILIFCAALTTVSLMALGYMKSIHTEADRQCNSERATLVSLDGFKSTVNNLYAIDLFYSVGSRFIARITKEKVFNAKSIKDLIPENTMIPMVPYENVKVAILHKDDVGIQLSETGQDEMLNDAQMKLLQTTEYSNNIFISGDYKWKNEYTGNIEYKSMTLYITIVPEKEAEFKSGHKKLIEYIKSYNNEKTTIIKQDQLKSGMVSFIVTDQGKIKDVTLTSTSGYDSFDDFMIEMIESLQGEWEPAQNSKGENVNQELILVFGVGGC